MKPSICTPRSILAKSPVLITYYSDFKGEM